MNIRKIVIRLATLLLALIPLLALSTSVCGYWVDSVHVDCNIDFKRNITVLITGITPSEDVTPEPFIKPDTLGTGIAEPEVPGGQTQETERIPDCETDISSPVQSPDKTDDSADYAMEDTAADTADNFITDPADDPAGDTTDDIADDPADDPADDTGDITIDTSGNESNADADTNG